MHPIRRGAAFAEPVVPLGIAVFVGASWIGAERGSWWLIGLVLVGLLAVGGVAGLLGMRSASLVVVRAVLGVGALALASLALPTRSLVLDLWFGVLAVVYSLVLPSRLAVPAVVLAAAGFGSGAVAGDNLIDPLPAAAGCAVVLALGLAGVWASRTGITPIPENQAPPSGQDGSLGVAFDTAAGGLAFLDADARIVRGNQALADLLGRSPDALAGTSWWGHLGPDDVEPQQAKLRQLLTGQIWNFHTEARLRTRDRRLVWAVVGMSLIAGSTGGPHRIFVQVVNIDERVRREVGLRERVTGTRRSFEHAPVAMWEIGLVEIEPALERWRRDQVGDLRLHLRSHADMLRHTVATLDIRDVNEAAKRMVGAEGKEEFVRGVRGGRLGPGFEEALAGQLDALWRGRTQDAATVDLVDFDGGRHPGLVQMTIVSDADGEGASAILVAFTELAELLQRQDALTSVGARLHSVVSATPVVLFATDASGLFTLWEGRALVDLDMSPGEVVGRSVFEVYREAPGVVAAMRRALDGEAFTASAELGGHRFTTRYTPVFERGRVEGVIGLAVDVEPVATPDGPTGREADVREAEAVVDVGVEIGTIDTGPEGLEPAGGPAAAASGRSPWSDEAPGASAFADLDDLLPHLGSVDVAEEGDEFADRAEIEPADVDLSDLSALLGGLAAESLQEDLEDPDEIELPDVPDLGTEPLHELELGIEVGGGVGPDPGEDAGLDGGGDLPGEEAGGDAEPTGVEAIDLWEQVDLALAYRLPSKPIATNRDGSMAKAFGTQPVIQDALRVLLDNAHEHGGARLTVRVDRLGDEWALSVIDDGPGMPAEVQSRLFGVAWEHDDSSLAAIRRRVRELGGDLSYDYRQGHSVFAVTLPAV